MLFYRFPYKSIIFWTPYVLDFILRVLIELSSLHLKWFLDIEVHNCPVPRTIAIWGYRFVKTYYNRILDITVLKIFEHAADLAFEQYIFSLITSICFLNYKNLACFWSCTWFNHTQIPVKNLLPSCVIDEWIFLFLHIYTRYCLF